MQLLSDEDLDLRRMTERELEDAWDLWFDLAQTTNDHDPPFAHGVFVALTAGELAALGGRPRSHRSPRATP